MLLQKNMVELINFYISFRIYFVNGNKLYPRIVWKDTCNTCKECIFLMKYCYNIHPNNSLKKSCITNDSY